MIQLIIAEPANVVAQARTLLTTAVTQPDDTASWSFQEWIETILVYKLPQPTRQAGTVLPCRLPMGREAFSE